ncbi:IPT/TIG domain-containing protein [Corallococcus sicarius]|uniref:IPT/TIG domain-containing protein n=1 Tax=Corallococcus sicarius TaxID=2316726 RepID=UPI0011C46FB2|nr:IPT/TIG domain-containing protein [Corallococcus sicarius]
MRAEAIRSAPTAGVTSRASLSARMLWLALWGLTGCVEQRDAEVLPEPGTPAASACEGVAPRTLEEVHAAHFAAERPTGCTVGCHDTGAGGLTFRSAHELWQATVQRPSLGDSSLLLVDPGHPERSRLYLKLLPDAQGRMPQGGPSLDAAALRDVAGWICAGAPEPSTSATDGGLPANPVPTLDTLTPSAVQEGVGEVLLSVGGGGFVAESQVEVDGLPVVTTHDGPQRLEARVAASVTARAGTHQVRVVTPAPGGGASASLVFTVTASGVVLPTVSSLSPCGTVAGSGAFTLTVQGMNFKEGASLSFNGTTVAATFISPGELRASIPAALVASAPVGNAATVTVVHPAPGREVSAPATFGVASKVATLATDVQPLFTATCATSGCHATASTPVNLTPGNTYNELVGVPTSSKGCGQRLRVQACGPLRGQSFLIDKILATNSSPACSGGAMPKGSPLSAAQKQAVIDWVAQGAPR